MQELIAAIAGKLGAPTPSATLLRGELARHGVPVERAETIEGHAVELEL